MRSTTVPCVLLFISSLRDVKVSVSRPTLRCFDSMLLTVCIIERLINVNVGFLDALIHASNKLVECLLCTACTLTVLSL